MPPAAQGLHVALSRRQHIQITGRGDELGRDACAFGLGLEQNPQQIGQRRVHLQLVALAVGLRHVGGFASHACGHGFQNAFGDFPLAGLAQQQTGAVQLFAVRGFEARQFDQCVILEHAIARDIAGAGVILTKGGQFADDRQKLGRIGPGLDPLPRILRLGHIGIGAEQRLKLLGHPTGAAGLFKLARQKFVNLPQVGHIGQRIGLLCVGQRTAGPIGKARGLVQRLMRDLAHQGLIAHLFAKAADHRGHLRVEQRFGKDLGVDVEDLKILPCRVEHFDHRCVAEQIVKRLKRDAVGQGIDQHGVAVVGAGHGKLDEAELGIIGPLTQEFRVDGHVIMARSLFTELREVGGRGDGFHKCSLTSCTPGHRALSKRYITREALTSVSPSV